MFELSENKCPGCDQRMALSMLGTGDEYCPDDNCPINQIPCDHGCGTLLPPTSSSTTCGGCQFKEELEIERTERMTNSYYCPQHGFVKGQGYCWICDEEMDRRDEEAMDRWYEEHGSDEEDE